MALLVLGGLVIVHEYGHFLVARWAGVRILRFSVGFGPRLFSWTRGHTEYAVSAIPLGGYVKMAGEQYAPSAAESRPKGEPWEYLSKPIGVRAAIVFAGPFMNYLIALLTLWAVFIIGYPELLPVVGKVEEGTPAHAAGLQPGDRVVSVNDLPVPTWEAMAKMIHASPGRPLALRVMREEAVNVVTIVPAPASIPDPFNRMKTVGRIGAWSSGQARLRRVAPLAAIGEAFHQQNEFVIQTMAGLLLVITGRVSMRDSMTGPIGIMYMGSEAMRSGVPSLLSFISVISLSLAIFNLFPIPILDGGHLFFLAVEQLRGRPVSMHVQERSAQVSFLLLVTLVLVICINDVNRFGLVEKLFGWVR
jgi:regulator of sigma E protease